MADQHSTETAETLTDDTQHIALNATDETPAAKGTTIKHKCNICQTPAKLCCTGCDPTPLADEGASKKTWYCTRYCQMKDRMSHKAYCKGIQAKVDLRSLQRATRVLQALFNLCRHIGYDLSIGSVERQGTDLYIEEGKYDLINKLLPGFESVESLPKVEPEDHAMLLTLMSCSDAAIDIHECCGLFLEGMYHPSSST